MPILVIDTVAAACSVALLEGSVVLAERHRLVGRGHAEQLVPMIASLPDGGRADSVLVDCGPGSFTGIRVGIAAARALALAWRVPVAGYASTAAMAAAAFAGADAPDRIAVVLEGGHGELFVERFARDPLRSEAPLASLKPAAALAAIGRVRAIGSGVRWLEGATGIDADGDALPAAADARHLPAAFASRPAVPIYGRAPDALPQAAR